jgi:hypothetical protein
MATPLSNTKMSGRPCHSSGGCLPASYRGDGSPGSSPDHIMWDLWWRKWHWGTFPKSTLVSLATDCYCWRNCIIIVCKSYSNATGCLNTIMQIVYESSFKHDDGRTAGPLWSAHYAFISCIATNILTFASFYMKTCRREGVPAAAQIRSSGIRTSQFQHYNLPWHFRPPTR